MPRDPAVFLDDIVEACRLIESYIEGFSNETFTNRLPAPLPGCIRFPYQIPVASLVSLSRDSLATG